MYRIFSRHQCRTRWCTYGSHIIFIQYQSRIGKCIDIWCRNLCGSMETNIIPSLIINCSKKKKKTQLKYNVKLADANHRTKSSANMKKMCGRFTASLQTVCDKFKHITQITNDHVRTLKNGKTTQES